MKIFFVLVEPKVPENIGASARALKTMGFDSMVLVNPADWREGKSRRIAHGSDDILENAKVYGSLAEALTGMDFSVATSMRRRKIFKDIVPVKELSEFILSKSEHLKNIAIIFGREESGLTNEEIRLCDIVSAIPMPVKYPSLNLSQAVMIYAYELSEINSGSAEITVRSGEESESYTVLREKTMNILLKLGLKKEDNRFGRLMERLAFLKGDDINLAHTLCNLIDKKL